MASIFIHIAFAIIIVSALLPLEYFSVKSLLISLFFVVLVDIDSFSFLFGTGLHRAASHNVVIPSVIILFVLFDVVSREDSILGKYFNTQYILLISIVSYIAVMIAGIGLDLIDTGVNLFWPIHDQFYTVKGQFVISSKEGIIQTFTDTFFEKNTIETTENTVYKSSVNPSSDTPKIYPIAYKGWEFIMLATSVILVGYKFIFKKYNKSF